MRSGRRIRGWAQYHRHVMSKVTFSSIVSDPFSPSL
ncbi:group II intron maturase-specific domain-containing protein [Paraburkholderia mimosarum]